jgi:hypothetical protein
MPQQECPVAHPPGEACHSTRKRLPRFPTHGRFCHKISLPAENDKGTEAAATVPFDSRRSLKPHAVGHGQEVEPPLKGRVLLDVLHSGRVKITKAMTLQEQEQERKLFEAPEIPESSLLCLKSGRPRTSHVNTEGLSRPS